MMIGVLNYGCGGGGKVKGSGGKGGRMGVSGMGRALLVLALLQLPFGLASSCDCGPGTYQTESGECAICDPGTYQPVNGANSSSACLECPAGYACASASSSPQLCPSGTYSPAGWAGCVACPPGYACETPSSTPEECSAGRYAVGGARSCKLCPLGRWQPNNGSSTCLSCPAGRECDDDPGLSLAELPLCARGTASLEGEGVCRACAPGTHTNGEKGASRCETCPAGKECADPRDAPSECPQGRFSTGGAAACSACPLGSRGVSDGERSRCLPCRAGERCGDPQGNGTTTCPAGTYKPAGVPLGDAGLCPVCPAGTFCPGNDASPLPCPAGRYSGAGAENCTICPAGSSCPAPSLSPEPCPAGTYSLRGDAVCRSCPRGYECYDTSLPPVECVTGSYSLGGALNCTTCVAGEACGGNEDVPIRCPAGTYALAGDTQCTVCPAGFSCANAALEPIACSNGTYALGGADSCVLSPAGHMWTSFTTTPTPCAPGTFNAVAGSDSCTTCPAGHRCPEPSSNAPMPCPAGTTSDEGAVRCDPCPAGYACPNATNPAYQIQCSAGRYATGAASECQPCPLGWACPATGGLFDGAGNAPCPLGSYVSEDQTSCITCPAGSECPSPSNTSLISVCPDGFWATAGSVACKACPPGYECPNKDGSGITACAAGSYSPSGVSTCTPCPAGYSCDSFESASVRPCPRGSYALQDTDMTCTDCPAGYFCANSTEAPEPCPTGTYAPAAGRRVECTLCPAGHSCTSTVASECPVGTYSFRGNGTCYLCASGFRCPAGSTEAAPAGAECAEGFYCPQTSLATAGESIPCPAGRYGYRIGGSTVNGSCRACEPGYYCPEGSVTATRVPCPPGSWCPGLEAGVAYFSSSYATGAAIPCDAGTYNPDYKATVAGGCRACPPGRYCGVGSTDFGSVCPAGYYCPANSTSGTDHPCPAGRYSGGGRRGLESEDECLVCPAGHYCPEASETPTECPTGTFNPDTGMTQLASCRTCPGGWACPTQGAIALTVRCAAGYWCDPGTVNPDDNACSEGTYTDAEDAASQSDCLSCPPRKSCRSATGGSLRPQDCVPGYYCPGGSGDSSDSNNLWTDASATGVCPSGSLCYCPPGRYSAADNLKDADECEHCPEGYYCSGGLTTPDGPCQGGYFCPNGTVAADDYPCPSGRYSAATNNTQEEDCDWCPPGSYCPGAETTPNACPAGRYSPGTGVPSVSECLACPAGYICPGEVALGTTDSGSIIPVPCAPGNHSDGSDWECAGCEVGHFCPENATTTAQMYAAFRCPAGLYCPSGFDRYPDETLDACPPGYFCEEATVAPEECPAGTYNPHYGGVSEEEDCLPCPAGSYCEVASANITGVCARGYFCPEGSVSPMERECPAKYYNAHEGARKQSDCALCTSGDYCPTNATVTPVECPTGSYCVTGVDEPEPCPPGSYGNTSGLRRAEDCSPCQPGTYCAGWGLTEPSGECRAGYYCLEGSPTSAPAPEDDPLSSEATPLGGLCPPGGYCPQGSSKPTSCPAGTFSNVTGAEDDSVCLPCTPGYYCQGSSNPYPTGPCDAGYYCTGSASTPNQFSSPPGYYSISGSPNALPCRPGTYNNVDRATECEPCPAGRFCSNFTTILPESCTTGHYCPEGSADPEPCHAGTYNGDIGSKNETDCIACPAGMHCNDTGLTEPTGECNAGFYCVSGAAVPNPGDPGEYLVTTNGSVVPISFLDSSLDPLTCPDANTTHVRLVVANYAVAPLPDTSGGPCPPGYYCPQGTMSPRQYPCPNGTYNPFEGATEVDDCLLCTAGHHCPNLGMSEPGPTCRPGYYCTLGSSTAAPQEGSGVGGPCPTGSFCTGEEALPEDCPPGTFGNTTLLSECFQCPERYQCDGNTPDEPQPCPAGSYCPAGTGVSTEPCPPGTYSDALLLATADECIDCAPGRYCPEPGGLTSSGPKCAAGFVCPGGAADQYGRFWNETGENVDESGDPRTCPAGHYCPLGTKVPEQCPRGTYLPSEGHDEAIDCIPCAGGKYCAGTGLTTPSGPCAKGHYCARGNEDASPDGGVLNVTAVVLGGPLNGTAVPMLIGGDRCPGGYICDNGTSVPDPCPPGTYLGTEGGEPGDCIECPAGYWCPEASTDFLPYPCPEGYYCPAGSISPTANPCPPGTYSNETKYRSEDECIACPGGYYCAGEASLEPDGPCDSGYYCAGNASTPRPNDGGVTGAPCDAGEYCPEGSAIPLLCRAGSYCTDASGTPTGLCYGGFYCTGGSFTPTPNGELNTRGDEIGDICPQGHYCVEGSVTPIPCPAGTYNPVEGQVNVSDCRACPAGHYCNGTGLVEAGPLCTAGFYCENSTVVPTLLCPRGFYCPLGSPEPFSCQAGTYQADRGQANCDVCPQGFWCGIETVTPNDCPAGFYCPDNTTHATANPCPAGTFSDRENLAAELECEECLEGQYCGSTGLTSPSGNCSAGHYCIGGAWSSSPTDGFDNGYVCSLTLSAGCNVSSSTSGVCTSLTPSYAPDPTAWGECPVPGFGGPDRYWLGADIPSWPEGFTPAENATVEEVLPETGDMCPRGHYCPEGSSRPIPCPSGTYNPTFGGENSTACRPCLSGYFCPNTTTVYPTQLCPAGYYCSSGLSDPLSLCPRGSYCPRGSSSPRTCTPGTYSNDTGLETCLVCPAGNSCPGGTIEPEPCAAGYFCPKRTGEPTEQPCPAGTYSNETNLQRMDQCNACPPGSYCHGAANTQPDGDCAAGWYCTGSSPSPTPGLDLWSVGGAAFATVNASAPLNTSDEVCDEAFGRIAWSVESAEVLEQTIGLYAESEWLGAVRSLATMQADAFLEGQSYLPNATAAFLGLLTGGFGAPCPPGAYCPSGVSAPQLCPIGTFLNATGAKTEEDCISCPRRYACGFRGLIVPLELCPAGSYCPGGVGVAANAPLCPNGSYCPEGSAEPIVCPPSTYTDSTGQSECLDCPPGSACSGGTITPASCEKGFYCPERSNRTDQLPCPAGTFSNQTGRTSVDECIPCPAGQYCDSPGLAEPSGPCGPGHYCSGGATTPTPSNVAEGGGHCDHGYVCTFGSRSAVPQHPLQGWLDAEEALTPLYEGVFGLVSVPWSGEIAGPGAKGLYEGSREANGTGVLVFDPTQEFDPMPAIGFACPSGTYCPVGSTVPIGCPPGTYAESPGSSFCRGCPLGRFCEGNTSIPEICPIGSYCPRNTSVPQPCPSGTFGEEEGMHSAWQCSFCPGGSYCAGDGTIAGDCAAGFVCRGNNTVSRPTESTVDYTVGAGFPCPAGSYCPAGSAVEIPCPVGTFSGVEGAANISACGPCPSGFTCVEGSTTAVSCRRGRYCPGDGKSYECPTFTYNPDTQADSLDDCGPCPGGAFCNATAISDPISYPCPPGHFCGIGARIPVPCRGGSFRANPRGSNASSCDSCPAGSYCPVASVQPTPCPGGFYCLNESAIPRECPGASFCPAGDPLAPRPCPAGYICPPGSASPEPCPSGGYCPADSAAYEVCPAGTLERASVGFTSRVSEDTACEACEAGTYSDGRDGTECLPCPEGYVCLDRCSSATPTDPTPAADGGDGGYECPPGHYCPEGSTTPTACPVGTYQPLWTQGSNASCLACPDGSYGASEGLAACRPCSSSSTSGPSLGYGLGASNCLCRGEYRSFQPSDGKCVCAPGYEFVANDLTVLSEEDGEEDCQPKNVAYCDTSLGEVRDALGNCVTLDCASICPGGAGKYLPSMLGCACEGQPPLEDTCDEDCRMERLRIVVLTDGSMVLWDPVTGNSTAVSPDDDIPGFRGSLTCPSAASGAAVGDDVATINGTVPEDTPLGEGCELHSMSLGPDGFDGIYGAASTVQGGATNQGSGRGRRLERMQAHREGRRLAPLAADRGGWSALEEDSTSSTASLPSGLTRPQQRIALRRRRLEARRRRAQSSSSGPTVSRPAVCIREGESLLFELPEGTDNYPVYVKDSYLNTNEDFDYGAFRRLAELAASDGSDATAFGFTFSAAGVYVFASSADPTAETTVVVTPSSESCPTGGPFVPQSESNLASLGIAESTPLLLGPNWLLLAVLLGGVMFLVAVVLLAIYEARRRAWGGEMEGDGAILVATAEARAKARAVHGGGGGGGGGGWCGGGRAKVHPDDKDGSGDGGVIDDSSDPEAGKVDEESKMEDDDNDGGGTTFPPALPGSTSAAAKAAVAAKWGDPDDEDRRDLAELLAELRAQQAEVRRSFASQAKASKTILDSLKREADGLRRMLAKAALESGASTEGTAGGLAARRAAVLRQLEAEAVARTLFDRAQADREAAVMEALRGLLAQLQPSATDATVSVLDELEHFGEVVDGSVKEKVESAKAVRVHDSDRARQILTALQKVANSIEMAASELAQERRREAEGIPMWRAAAGAGLMGSSERKSGWVAGLLGGEERKDDDEGEEAGGMTSAEKRRLEDALRVVEKSRQPVDVASEAALRPFVRFLSQVDGFGEALHRSFASFLQAKVHATERQNRGLQHKARVRAETQGAQLLGDLESAIRALLGTAPRLLQRSTRERDRAMRLVEDARKEIADARKAAAEAASAGRMDKESVRGLLARVEQLIERVNRGDFSDLGGGGGGRRGGKGGGGGVRTIGDALDGLMDGDFGSGDEDEFDDEFDDDEDGGASGEDGAAALLVRKVEEEAAREAKEAEERLAAERAKEKAERLKREAEERRRREKEMEDAALAEDQRKRLLDEYDKDRAHVGEALEREKERQQAELRRRLEERKAQRMQRRMHAAEAAAARRMEEERAKEAEQLRLKHEKEMRELKEGGESGEEVGGVKGVEKKARSARRTLADASAAATEALAVARSEANSSAVDQCAEGRMHAGNVSTGRIDAAVMRCREAKASPVETTEIVNREVDEAWSDAADAMNEGIESAMDVLEKALEKARDDAHNAFEEAIAAAKAERDSCVSALEKAYEESEKAMREAAEREGGGDAAAIATALDIAGRTLERQHAAAQAAISSLSAAVVSAEAALAAELKAWSVQDDESIEAARRAESLERDLAVSRGKRLGGLAASQAAEEAGMEWKLDAALARQQADAAAAAARAEDEAAEDRRAALEARDAAARRKVEDQVKRIHEEADEEAAQAAHALATERDRQREAARRRLQARRDARKRHGGGGGGGGGVDEASVAAVKAAREAIGEDGGDGVEDEIGGGGEEEKAEEDGKTEDAIADAAEKAVENATDTEAKARQARREFEEERGKELDARMTDRRRQQEALRRRLAERKAHRALEARQRRVAAAEAAAEAARAAGKSEEEAQAAADAAAREMDEENAAEERAASEDDAAELARLRARGEAQNKVAAAEAREAAAAMAKATDMAISAGVMSVAEALEAIASARERAASRKDVEAEIALREKEMALRARQAKERKALEEQASRAHTDADSEVAKAALTAAAEDADWEDKVLKVVAEGGGDGSGEGGAGELDAETKARIEAEAKAREEELRRKQEEEKRKEEERIAEELAREAEEKARAEEERRKAKLEAKRRELAARMEAANLSTAEEMERMKAEHEKELAEYGSKMDAERQAQQERLQKRLAERKARRERALARKHAREAEEAEEARKRAEAEAAAAAAKEREKAALAKVLKDGEEEMEKSGGGGGEAGGGGEVGGGGGGGEGSVAASVAAVAASRKGDAIEAVLQERHARETADLLATQYAERSRLLAAALEDVLEETQEKRASEEERLAEERAAAEADAKEQGLDVEAALKRVNEAAARRSKRIEDEAAQKRQEAEEKVREDLETKHATEQLALRRRQLEELSATLAELAPEEVLRRREAEEAAEEAANLRKFQEDLEKENKERLERLRKEREEYEAKVRAENDAALAELEEEHRKQLEEEQRRAENAAKMRKKRMEEEQEAARKRAEEENAHLDEEERDRIMREFDENRQRIETRLDQQRMEQQERLQRRLEARRARKAAMIEAKAAEAARKERERQEVERRKVAEEEARKKREAEEAASKRSESDGSGVGGVGVGGAVRSSLLPAPPSSARMVPKASRATLALQSALSKARMRMNTGLGGKKMTARKRSSMRRRGSSSQRPGRGSSKGSMGSVGGVGGASGSARVEDLGAIEARLNRIEALVAEVSSAAQAAQQSTTTSSSSTSLVVHGMWSDPSNESNPTEGELVAVADTELQTRERMRLNLAHSFLDALGLGKSAGGARVLLGVAAKLPHKPSPVDGEGGSSAAAENHNAYVNFFHWEPSSRKLWIRRSQLNNTGQLAVLLAHCGAHILAHPDAMVGNDTDIMFQQHFHQAMRVIVQRLFFRGVEQATAEESGASTKEEASETAATLLGARALLRHRRSSAMATTRDSEGKEADDKALKRTSTWKKRTTFFTKVGKAMSKMRGLKSMGVRVRDMLHRIPDEDDADRNDEIAAAGARGRSTGEFAAGSIADRLSSMQAFSSHVPLQQYLRQLEQRVLDEDTEDGSSGGGRGGGSGEGGVGAAITAAPSALKSAEEEETQATSTLSSDTSMIQDQIDRADFRVLDQVRAISDIERHVDLLRGELRERESSLSLVQRAKAAAERSRKRREEIQEEARRDGAVLTEEEEEQMLAERDAEDEDLEAQGIDPAALPSEETVQSQVDATKHSLQEAQAALETYKEARERTKKVAQTLRDELKRREREG